MATLSIAAHGYGIRYDNGLFRQIIRSGWQQEAPEDWLAHGNPWEFERAGGQLRHRLRRLCRGGRRRRRHDAPCLAARRDASRRSPSTRRSSAGAGRHVNTLRLWSARAPDPLKLDAFNAGDYLGALADNVRAEAISKVLYPERRDAGGPGAAAAPGIFLRLRLAARSGAPPCASSIATSARSASTSRCSSTTPIPAIAVAELMRILVDMNRLDWEEAWEITTIGVLLHQPYAAAGGAGELAGRADGAAAAAPHADHLSHQRRPSRRRRASAGSADSGVLASISLIDEHGGRRVRMGSLAFVGSHKINGVSALHTNLMKETVFRDLNAVYPGRIVNKTNGITFRRWLMECNPRLTAIIKAVVGEKALFDAEALKGLGALRRRFGDCRSSSRSPGAPTRSRSASSSPSTLNQRLDPDALFDVQIKRIHEYKRQLLNILETIARYNEIRANPTIDFAPRVKIFAGKAAASYTQAKLIIKLAIDVARAVNSDPTVRGLLKVVFLPNYNVSLAETIIPAVDLSEQISTAGMEASGTGNMKMALNGALTIGTLDGANVELRDLVGDPNIFIFGLTARGSRGGAAQGHFLGRAHRSFADPARGARGGRLRRVLRRRPRPISRPRRHPALPRLFHGLRRFRRLLDRADERRRRLAQPQGLAALEHPQHRQRRLVLVGPHDRRIRERNLERADAADGAVTRRQQKEEQTS